MALRIVWTKRAEKGFDNIVEYLVSNFSDRDVRRFVLQSHRFFELLTEYPELLPRTNRHKNLRRGPLNKYTILTYQIKPRKGEIVLINIRSARKSP